MYPVFCIQIKNNFKKMKQIITTIFFLTIFSSCDIIGYQQKINVNIHSDTTLVLTKKINQEFISGFEFRISGEIEEKIIVTQTNGHNVAYKYELVGLVDSTFFGDWYADTCLIKFENINKPIKNIEIGYTFY